MSQLLQSNSLETLTIKLKEAMGQRQNSVNTQKLLALTEEQIDRRLYGIYLVETFHYTKHNTKNQAAVIMREEKIDVNYMKFCLHHAYEEAGHEYMALSDLNSMGYTFKEENLSKPLPSTETLIAYLYRTATQGNVFARLGYSFWAESVYQYNKYSKDLFKSALNLKSSQMTFLEAHAQIDEGHFEEVSNIIKRFVKTEKDWLAVEETMIHTLLLTGKIMEEVMGQYLNMVEGIPTRYDYLEPLKGKRHD